MFFNISLAKGIIFMEIGLANGTTLNMLAADPLRQTPTQNLAKNPLSKSYPKIIQKSIGLTVPGADNTHKHLETHRSNAAQNNPCKVLLKKYC